MVLGMFTAAGFPRLEIVVVEGRDLAAKDYTTQSSDPYAILTMNGSKQKTAIMYQTLDPRWMQTFAFEVKDLDKDCINIHLWDHDTFTPDDFMGMCTIPLKHFSGPAASDQWFQMCPRKGKRDKVKGAIRIIIRVIQSVSFSDQPRGREFITAEGELSMLSKEIDGDWWDPLVGSEGCAARVAETESWTDTLCFFHDSMMFIYEYERGKSVLRCAICFWGAKVDGVDCNKIQQRNVFAVLTKAGTSYLFKCHDASSLKMWLSAIRQAKDTFCTSLGCDVGSLEVLDMQRETEWETKNINFHGKFPECLFCEESLIEQFTCVLNAGIYYHGTLFVASSCLCFYSDDFESCRIIVPFGHVKNVQKSQTAFSNTIQVSILEARGAEQKVLTFMAFRQKEIVYQTLLGTLDYFMKETKGSEAREQEDQEQGEASERGTRGRSSFFFPADRRASTLYMSREMSFKGIQAAADASSTHGFAPEKASTQYEQTQRKLVRAATGEVGSMQPHPPPPSENGRPPKGKPKGKGKGNRRFSILDDMHQRYALGGASAKRAGRKARSQAVDSYVVSDVVKGVKIEDFQVVETLGEGSYGFVRLLKHKGTSQMFATKFILQEKTQSMDKVSREVEILSNIAHPFVVSCYGRLDYGKYACIFMENVVGGELYRLTGGNQLKEEYAKFYAAEIILALQYFHNHNILYRDLKPENLLVEADGHLKFIDFGFAKEVEHRTFTLCGTPEYLAPEVVRNAGHGRGCDYWSLGVFIYEMVHGKTPFFAELQQDLYENIVARKFTMPKHFSKALRQLVDKLLAVDPAKRLGCLKGGAEDVKRNRWFKKLDWNEAFQRKLEPPWMPLAAQLGFDEAKPFDAEDGG